MSVRKEKAFFNRIGLARTPVFEYQKNKRIEGCGDDTKQFTYALHVFKEKGF